jgi:hypothetical protein
VRSRWVITGDARITHQPRFGRPPDSAQGENALVGDCPNKEAAQIRHRCDPYCPDLPRLFLRGRKRADPAAPAEVAVPRALFQTILGAVAALRLGPPARC